MKKSYYDKTKNCYIDTTRGVEYYPKGVCEICGATYGITIHHYIPQQTCLRDTSSKKIRYPKMLTQEFINENQRLIELCLQHHADVHNLTNSRFLEKYGRERSEFIYLE